MSKQNSKRTILYLENIGRHFGTEAVVSALSDVHLQLNQGEWLAITGPSGSGKSTLLNIIGCLDRQSSGRYLLQGIDTATLSEKERAGLRSQHIGFVFQSFNLLSHRTVLENVMLGEVYRSGSTPHLRHERALTAIDRVGLSHRVDYLPGKLSGGEQQRVAIARALIASPRLLLCDEPTGNLDSKASENILGLFSELNQQGLTLVVVTHDEKVARAAGRRAHIIDGKLTNPTPNGSTIDRSAANVQMAASTLRSAITASDLVNEAIAGIFERPGRMMLTMLGIVIGITALVATLGLSRTANNRIISQFDELAATEIVVTTKADASTVDGFQIPWDAPSRLQRLNGVREVGTLSTLEVGDLLVSASPLRDPHVQTVHNLAIQAVSPELFPAVRAELLSGRFFDNVHSMRQDRVAILGPRAAQRLGIQRLDQLPAIAVGDYIYLVVGILRDVGRQPDLLSSVIIPEGAARKDFNLSGPQSVIIETQIGAVPLIVRQTPHALRPDDPGIFKMEFPPEPQRVRDAVQADLNGMFLLLGGLSLVVGAIGIGNITLVSVMERTREIGLRRAIGATRGHVAAQFLIESASMGLIGGILGASVGVLAVVSVSAYQVWTPVLDPFAPLLAPFLGGLIGLIAGTYPALRAANMEPVEAFRY